MNPIEPTDKNPPDPGDPIADSPWPAFAVPAEFLARLDRDQLIRFALTVQRAAADMERALYEAAEQRDALAAAVVRARFWQSFN